MVGWVTSPFFSSDFLKLVCYAQSCISMYIPKHIIHILMRDEKEERSKQGQTNKQGICQTCSNIKLTLLILMAIET